MERSLWTAEHSVCASAIKYSASWKASESQLHDTAPVPIGVIFIPIKVLGDFKANKVK